MTPRGSLIVRLAFVAVGLLAAAPHASAQNVLVAGAVAGDGLYPTLGAAFTAINGSAQTGATITISILGDTSEAASAQLNQSLASSILITPAGGAARAISGDVNGAVVDLNGADQVTIDGLNTGGNALTLSNINTGSSASALRLINDASNNRFERLTLAGSSTSIVGGVVLLSTAAASGNDGNVFESNVITAAGANAPTNAFASLGTASVGMENSGNQILNNQISGFFSASQMSTGILIGAGNDDFGLVGNRLFQPSSLNFTTANTHFGILILSGNGYLVSGNVIGFATNAGTGTWSMTSVVATRFVGIRLAVDNSSTSSVQNNTVAGFSLSTSSGAATANGVFCGISVTSGQVNIGTVTGNTIGATSGLDSIVVTSTTTQAAIVGIHDGSADLVDIRNNSVGALRSSGVTAVVAGAVFPVRIDGTGAVVIRDNTLGNATAHNLRAGTSGLTTGNSLAAGITFTNITNPSAEISGNLIRNLSSYGTGSVGYVRGVWTSTATSSPTVYTISNNQISALTTTTASTAVSNGQTAAVGINLAVGTNSLVSANTISNIEAANFGTAGTLAVGISSANATNTTIAGNLIFDIRNASTSTSVTAPGRAIGIMLRSGTAAVNVQNNMIGLGTGQSTNTAFIGIQANHGSAPDPIDRIYYNSIRIAGVVAVGAQPSFGFARTDFGVFAHAVTIEFRNNIVENVRSGGTGVHAAIANDYGATVSANGWPADASEFNVLNAAAASIGYWGGALDFAGWKAASAGDAHSYSNIALVFVNSASDLHLSMGVTPTPIAAGATAIAGLSVDFDGQQRPGPAGSVNGATLQPDIGADEFDGVVSDQVGPAIAALTVFRKQGEAGNSSIATVSDNATSAGAISVTVNGAPPAGITVGNLLNSAGTVSADVAVGCAVAVGTQMFSLRAGDAAAHTTDRDINIFVSDDTVPVLGVYPDSSGNTGATILVTPDVAPSDDVGASIVASAPDFVGSFAVHPVTGVVTITNAGPAGSHTVTVTSTDTCGQETTATFDLGLQGTPSVAVATPSQTAGDPAANLTLATVADLEDAEETLSVTVNGGAAATVNGVSVDTLAVDAAGSVSGNVIATCLANDANFQLRVTDSATSFSEATLSIDVTANTAPTLSYAPTAILIGTGGALSPTSGPSDTGSILGIDVSGVGAYTGGASVDAAGLVTLTNAAPAGDHTLTIRATDNCLAERQAPLLLTVQPIVVFANSFE